MEKTVDITYDTVMSSQNLKRKESSSFLSSEDSPSKRKETAVSDCSIKYLKEEPQIEIID